MATELEAFIRVAGQFFQLRRHKHSASCRVEILRESYGCWYRLGSGFYGEAWAHTGFYGLVLKISGPAGWGCPTLNQPHWSAADYGGMRLDAWPLFARHCMAHPYKNLPEIMHFEQVTQRMAWAVMPRYDVVYCMPYGAMEVRNALEGDALGPVAEWIWPLVQMASGLHIEVDLHTNNVMEDPVTGEWIILDPFSTTGA